MSARKHWPVALSLAVTVGLLASVICAVVVVVETRATTRLLAQTSELSSELRQSSDDLTRFVRTFVVTGNHSYWDYYLEVVNIRNGMAPLPNEPWRNHWDVFIADGVAPRGYGQPSSLRGRIRDAGFTSEEIALLDEAQRLSDKLIDLETVAYNAILGRYRPASTAGLTEAQARAFSVTAPPNQTLAMELVHGVLYHREKGNIMRPLDEFAAHATERVQSQADDVLVLGVCIAGATGLFALVSAVLTGVQFRRATMLQTALDLASDVAAALAAYDTEKALQLIGAGCAVCAAKITAAESQDAALKMYDGASSSTTIDDPIELVGSALVTITENMKLYRPHLPNWVVELACRGSDDDIDLDEDEDEGAYSELSVTDLESATTPRSKAEACTPKSHASRPSIDKSGKSSGAYANSNEFIAGKPSRAFGTGEVFRVVAALLHFDIDAHGASFAGAMHAVSDAIHAAASATVGAVHGFSCDTVVVSWGAARRVVQPDAKAATFMLKVRAALAKQATAATVSGAAISGEARPLLAGRGAQQALTMFALWRPALEAAAAFAHQTSSLLVGPRVEHEARFAATLRGVAAISVPQWAALKRGRGRVTSFGQGQSQGQSPAPQSAPGFTPVSLNVFTVEEIMLDSNDPTAPLGGSKWPKASLRVTDLHATSMRQAKSPCGRGGGPTVTLELYELVGGRSDAQDEWLYVVNNKGGEEHAKVERAFTLGLAGGQAKGQEGLAVLQGLGADTLAAPTVQHLRRRLQAVADGEAITIAV